jgi:hypothetical protein
MGCLNTAKAQAEADKALIETFDLVEEIIAYEGGYESESEEDPETRMIRLFQHLVDTGMAWKLQGSYGRAAVDLLNAGYISAPQPFAEQA